MPPAVRAPAAELLPRARDLARGMTDHPVANVSELSARARRVQGRLVRALTQRVAEPTELLVARYQSSAFMFA
jgi:hypothetical protein